MNPMIRRIVVPAVCLAVVSACASKNADTREPSVAPGINAGYGTEEGRATTLKILEGEGREKYPGSSDMSTSVYHSHSGGPGIVRVCWTVYSPSSRLSPSAPTASKRAIGSTFTLEPGRLRRLSAMPIRRLRSKACTRARPQPCWPQP